jgi:hypothetical protein
MSGDGAGREGDLLGVLVESLVLVDGSGGSGATEGGGGVGRRGSEGRSELPKGVRAGFEEGDLLFDRRKMRGRAGHRGARARGRGVGGGLGLGAHTLFGGRCRGQRLSLGGVVVNGMGALLRRGKARREGEVGGGRIKRTEVLGGKMFSCEAQFRRRRRRETWVVVWDVRGVAGGGGR